MGLSGSGKFVERGGLKKYRQTAFVAGVPRKVSAPLSVVIKRTSLSGG